MRSRYGAALAAVCCAIAASPAAAGASTKVVYAGGPAKWQSQLSHRYGASVNNFLINTVTIHTGDTVVWSGASLSGGFHTVDIPKPGGSDLPLITPTGKTVSGVLDAAGNPFWFNGKVPALGFDPQLFAPAGGNVYNGTARVDSGLPLGPKPKDFAVKFTNAGVFKYYCDVHPGMIGYVVVRPQGKPIPGAAKDAAALRVAERAYTAEAAGVARTKTAPGTVSLGASGPGGVEVYGMFPAVLRVKPGSTVRFFMSKDTRETHTATFGPTAYLKPLEASFAGPAPDAQAIYPSDPPGHIVLTPTTHGNGFANTGALDRDPSTPLWSAGTITFKKPGTYRFYCLIHTFMHGTIIVR